MQAILLFQRLVLCLIIKGMNNKLAFALRCGLVHSRVTQCLSCCGLLLVIGCAGSGGGHSMGPTSLKQAFGFTGADQSFTVPERCTMLYVKLWGAGGANGGGSGAFVEGQLPVKAGQALTVVVGGSGGAAYYDIGSGGRTYGGGGTAQGISDVLAGIGGGRSAIMFQGNDLVDAGGGGGGTYVTIGAHALQGGGGGGIQTGDAGANNGGTGGTQAAGGYANGGKYQGGDRSGPGAGGGGGYYGGGGGSGADPSNYLVHAGGGGSSYTAGIRVISAAAGATGAGGVVSPGGAADSDYRSGVGIGGAPAAVGGNGLVVVSTTPFS